MGLTDELSRGNMQLLQGAGRMGQQVLLRYAMQNDGKQTMQDIMQGGKEMSQQAEKIFDRGQAMVDRAPGGAPGMPGGAAPAAATAENGMLPAPAAFGGEASSGTPAMPPLPPAPAGAEHQAPAQDMPPLPPEPAGQQRAADEHQPVDQQPAPQDPTPENASPAPETPAHSTPAHETPADAEPQKVVVDDIPNNDVGGVPATQLTSAELDAYRTEFAQHNVQFDYEQGADGSLEMTFASSSTAELAYGLDQTSMTLGHEPQLSGEQLTNEVDALAQQVSQNDPALNNPDLYLDMGMNR